MYEISMALRHAPEYWKDIKGYPNYSVSNLGRVKSRKTGKLLKSYQTRGYLRVSLYNDAGRKCKLVHRLVAEAFIPNPQNKSDVNHINGCKTDANACNLEWATASENMSHAHQNRLRPKLTSSPPCAAAKGRRFPKTELTV